MNPIAGCKTLVFIYMLNETLQLLLQAYSNPIILLTQMEDLRLGQLHTTINGINLLLVVIVMWYLSVPYATLLSYILLFSYIAR